MENEKKLNVYEKLNKIQTEIKVLKTLWNKFGNFYYRSAESIFKAVKPFLKELGMIMIVNDEIVIIGETPYVKAIISIIDAETKESIYSQAFARIPDSKKGMDASQLTGSTSSYARKYALNGLLLLDDIKDNDKVTKDLEAELEKHKNDRNYKKMKLFEIIEGTPIKLGQVKTRIDKEFGSYIEFNDLTDDQFLKITEILYKNLDALMSE